MFNLFNRNKEQKEDKKEKVCYVCGCFFKNGVQVTVYRYELFLNPMATQYHELFLSPIATQDYCLSCAPKYNTIICKEKELVYLKNNVECDENGIPLIGLEKPKSK